MLEYWIWLSRLPQVSWQHKKSLLLKFGDPEAVYRLSESAVLTVEGIPVSVAKAVADKDLSNARKLIRDCAEKRIGMIAYGDSAYPKKLKNIEDPPLVLFYKGFLPDWQGAPAIGVVGTRKASAVGLQTAHRMGFELASSGGLVVSGGADGIDTCALEGALQAGKPVVAVLGFGADVVYPAKNRELFARIEKNGCLITEYVPGTRPVAWNFPARNRIISGLASAILVVEAPARSGALNTARHAMDQGRDVFVVPGSVGQESCAGSNDLLRDRAMAAMCGWDILQEYESLYPGSVSRFYGSIPRQEEPEEKPESAKISIDNRKESRYSGIEKKTVELTEEEQQVIAYVSSEPKLADDILAELDMPAGKVLSILTRLSIKGCVKTHPGKLFSLTEAYQL